MITEFLSDASFTYDGTQLSPLFIRQATGVFSDAVVAWVGPCDVLPSAMVDLEDRLQKQEIRSQKMLHFVGELFDLDLYATIALTRLLASLLQEHLQEWCPCTHRDGDDVYVVEAGKFKKLTVSIATATPVSTLFHFGINVIGEGAPVDAIGLAELGVADIERFARRLLGAFKQEFLGIKIAARKVLSHDLVSRDPLPLRGERHDYNKRAT